MSVAKGMKVTPRACMLVVLAVLLAPVAVAHAQGTAPAATPPTLGALYQDGQTGRYLLGGTWLYQADPNNVGLAQGWADTTSTAGWSPATVPNAYNAGTLPRRA